VDDEPGIRFGVRDFLESEGLEVDEADSVAAAEKAVREGHPDAMILDHMLPDGTALDLLPRIRELEPTLPVVVLTGHATIDLAVGILTIVVQCLATGRLIARFGAGPAAAFLPFVFCCGFLALALTPALWVVIAFQAIQRTANFAISNPAREVLFTVLAREEKYKAKNVIDVVVFRGADAAGGWLFAALRAAGLELSAISLASIPAAAAWLALALALGRAQERRAGRPVTGSGRGVY